MEIDVYKFIDEFEDKVKKLNDEIKSLSPAKRCSNCGCDKWIGEHCMNCGENYRGD